jgi:hypothetical protein
LYLPDAPTQFAYRETGLLQAPNNFRAEQRQFLGPHGRRDENGKGVAVNKFRFGTLRDSVAQDLSPTF